MKLKIGVSKISGVKSKDCDPNRTIDLDRTESDRRERYNIVISIDGHLTVLSIMHPTPNTVLCGLHGPAGESFAFDMVPILKK